MDRAAKAKEYFLGGYNCSQSVVMAFADLLNVPEQTLTAIALPFGGGMGRLRQTCGGVSGAVMCLGLLFPDKSKAESYAFVQEFARRFQALNGSINCGELLSGVGLKVETAPQPEDRTQAYYKKRPCADLVYDSAQILTQMCIEEGIEA